MLKKVGFPVAILLALLILIPAPQAQARVHVGIGIGVGGYYPAYPAYPYTAPQSIPTSLKQFLHGCSAGSRRDRSHRRKRLTEASQGGIVYKSSGSFRHRVVTRVIPGVG